MSIKITVRVWVEFGQIHSQAQPAEQRIYVPKQVMQSVCKKRPTKAAIRIIKGN